MQIGCFVILTKQPIFLPQKKGEISMKLDRLMGILTVLLQQDRVTAPYLAQKFEVTRRTIGRDIDALCQAGIPVVTHQGTGGGISIAEGYKLDKRVLTTGELSDIVAALRGIGSVSEKSQIARTLDKLGVTADAGAVVSLQEPVVIDLASHYNYEGHLTKKIELLKRAIRESRCVTFDYFYEKGETQRRIAPYTVVFQWTSWYVFGFCTQRQDWRMFKLNRLWSLSLTDETFPMREVPPEKWDFGSNLTETHTVKALFDKSAKYLLVESYGPDSFCETEEGLYFQTGYTNRGYMVSWLLGFGDKVKALSPPELVCEMQATAKNILAHYG